MKSNPLDSNPFHLMGWKMPLSYAPHRFISELPDCSGLYSITYITNDNQSNKIVYIGMSNRLFSRIGNGHHEVVRKMQEDGIFPNIWFKQFPKDGLINEETKYIRMFNPSYNIRQKGRSL